MQHILIFFKKKNEGRNPIWSIYILQNVRLFLPDTSLGEPRLISKRRHSCVHQGVGLDKLQGLVREVYGALKGRSWTVTCTAPRSARTPRAKGQRSLHTIAHQGVIITCIVMDEKEQRDGGEKEQVLIRITKRASAGNIKYTYA